MNLPAGIIKLIFRYKNINYKLIEIVKQEFNEINSKIYDNPKLNLQDLFAYNMDIINVKEIKYDGCVCRSLNMYVFNKMKNAHIEQIDNKSCIITGDFLFKNKIINGKMIVPIRYSIHDDYQPYFICNGYCGKFPHLHLNRRGFWTLRLGEINHYEDHIMIKCGDCKKIIRELYY